MCFIAEPQNTAHITKQKVAPEGLTGISDSLNRCLMWKQHSQRVFPCLYMLTGGVYEKTAEARSPQHAGNELSNRYLEFNSTDVNISN